MTIKRSHILGLQVITMMLLVGAFLVLGAVSPIRAQSYLVPELTDSAPSAQAQTASTTLVINAGAISTHRSHKAADPFGFISRFVSAVATAINNLP